MNIPQLINEPVLAQRQLCHRQLNQVLLWLAAVACLIGIILYVDEFIEAPEQVPKMLLYIGASIMSVLAFKFSKYQRNRRYLAAYQTMLTKLRQASVNASVDNIQRAMTEAEAAEKTNHLITKLFGYYQPILNSRMTELHQKSLLSDLKKEFVLLENSCSEKINGIAKQVPLNKAKNHIEYSLEFLKNRRKEMSAQWEEAYEAFSWWNKMKYETGPDFSELDKTINNLSTLKKRLVAKHGGDFKQLDNHFRKIKQKAIIRMFAAKVEAERYIQSSSYQDNLTASILQKSMWFSAMSIPVSTWSDIDSAANVYDALRGVNSNFSDISNSEIWWESLFLPTESLAGLVALTKGAYFEQLVASDTDGQLYEHFNNPGADIVIDGVAFQLKATDNASYVYSVDESIPVIATSEVAIATGVIDSGYSNEELTNTVDNALGGTVVDIGDTAGDAILSGLGGLGFLATIKGINHASVKYENGGDAVESMFEGAGVAIEGTAQALVGAAEMGYNVLASRPSRFVGRVLLNGLNKLDEKMMEASNK